MLDDFVWQTMALCFDSSNAPLGPNFLMELPKVGFWGEWAFMPMAVIRPFEEGGKFLLANFSRSDLSRRVLQIVLSSHDRVSIDLKKCQGRREGRPFIAVHERMIPGDVVSVSRRHLKRKGMKKFPSRSRPRRGDGRFRETQIPNTETSSKIMNQFFMEFKNLRKRQKSWRHGLTRQAF